MRWNFNKLAATLVVAMAFSAQGLGNLRAAEPITEEEAHRIGVEAYLYFYPLVTMDVTRKVMTNVEAGKKPGAGPMNAFSHMRTYPAADMRAIVRPNFDTLYSVAWLDLTKEPVILSAPDTHGRYYLLPLLDMWTDVFAVPGKRTTGTAAVNFVVSPPHWKGRLPSGMEKIEAPTPFVWILGRTQTNGPSDYDAVHEVQDGYKITPLSRWGKRATAPAAKIDPSVDTTTPPLEQVNRLPPAKFFAYAAELMKTNPSHVTDWSQIARLRRIGIEQGKSFDFEKADPVDPARARKGGHGGSCSDEGEGADVGARRQWLADEHQHDGRLWRLLFETRDRRHGGSGGEPAGRRDISAQSRRQRRPAA